MEYFYAFRIAFCSNAKIQFATSNNLCIMNPKRKNNMKQRNDGRLTERERWELIGTIFAAVGAAITAFFKAGHK